MKDIQNRFHQVQQRIQKARMQCHRNTQNIALLAVSKTRTAAEIKQLYQLGQRRFGESYLQEALLKIEDLAELEIEWHFIGRIQSNKTRQISHHFSWVHGLYQLKHAQRLNHQRPTELAPLKVCIQVNIDKEASKAGILLNELKPLALEIQALPHLTLCGLMAIPSAKTDFEAQRQSFKQLKQALNDLDLPSCQDLSMGMSNDLEAAICEGATIVRVGTALFGARQ